MAQNGGNDTNNGCILFQRKAPIRVTTLYTLKTNTIHAFSDVHGTAKGIQSSTYSSLA